VKINLLFHWLALVVATAASTSGVTFAADGLVNYQEFVFTPTENPFGGGNDTQVERYLLVSSKNVGSVNRFYLSGIIGSSFASMTNNGSSALSPTTELQVDGNLTDSLLTGGGAIGLGITRPRGLLRLEIEARDRGILSGTTSYNLNNSGTIQNQSATTTATDAWSVMTNFWRDISLTKSLGLYGGGGIGFGGYQYAMATDQSAILAAAGSNSIHTFGWQVGTGISWAISKRITCDFGYRFFSFGLGETPLFDGTTTRGTAQSHFTASEFLFTFRIYEPFSGIF
jgi:opacity protein-like surface antigen